MELQAMIDRINTLSHKSKSVGLSSEEKEEQAELRRQYVAAFRKSLVDTLENTYIVDENGNKRKVTHK